MCEYSDQPPCQDGLFVQKHVYWILIYQLQIIPEYVSEITKNIELWN